MAITIAVCEMEAAGAVCREKKADYRKIIVDNPADYPDRAEIDLIVPLEKAKAAVGDWAEFAKRNRIAEDSFEVHISLLRDENDIETLTPLAEEIMNGWINVVGMPHDEVEAIIDKVGRSAVVTAWEALTFDELKEACLSCPLSWDKGRGCIGNFGPDDSLLPRIAKKHGCPIIASVPEAAKSGKIFQSSDADALAKEVAHLQEILPSEGKMMVRRYSGPLERLGEVAKVSMEQGCGFYFM